MSSKIGVHQENAGNIALFVSGPLQVQCDLILFWFPFFHSNLVYQSNPHSIHKLGVMCVCVRVHISSCSLFVYCSSYSMHACTKDYKLWLRIESFLENVLLYCIVCTEEEYRQSSSWQASFAPLGDPIQNKINPKIILSLFVLVLP